MTTTGWISTQLERVWHGTGKRPLDFDADLEQGADPGSFQQVQEKSLYSHVIVALGGSGDIRSTSICRCERRGCIFNFQLLLQSALIDTFLLTYSNITFSPLPKLLHSV